MRTFILVTTLFIFMAGSLIFSQDGFVPIDKMPETAKMVQPVYPEEAKKENITGYVIVKAYIDRNGQVTQAEVVECDQPGNGFEQAALDAAYLGEFKPAEQDGKPVGVWVNYKVQFKLDDKKSGK